MIYFLGSEAILWLRGGRGEKNSRTSSFLHSVEDCRIGWHGPLLQGQEAHVAALLTRKDNGTLVNVTRITALLVESNGTMIDRRTRLEVHTGLYVCDMKLRPNGPPGDYGVSISARISTVHVRETTYF